MVRVKRERSPPVRSTTSKRPRPSYKTIISRRSRPACEKKTDVSLRIAEKLLMDKKHSESNVVFCPLSINVLLSLVAAGSGGKTLDQFLDFLDSKTLDDVNSLASELISVVSQGDGGPKLSFATGAWLDQSLSLKDSFKQLVDKVYEATALKCVDFKNKADEATEEINEWMEMATEGIITEAIPPGEINKISRLVLANALYFKGKWMRPFDASTNKRRKFHLLNGTTIENPFMTDHREQLMDEYDGFKALELPYQYGYDERCFSMCFYLPDANDGLPDFIKKLKSEPDFLDRHVPKSSRHLREFWIPKFKISFSFEASEVLKSLGLVLPFSKEEADLTSMVDSSNGEILYVTDIFHTSIVEVNEEGTVAVGTSRKTVGGCSTKRPCKYYDFVADHPFLFVIREDNTGVVLFIGSVVNPRGK